MSAPRVSVIIATRDRCAILENCLNEYRRQTFSDIEFVIVDNGSTDGTEQMLSARNDVVYIRLAENVGATALNHAIDRARGEFLWRTDDDAYPRDAQTIALAVQHLEEHSSAAIVTGLVLNVNEGNQVIGVHPEAGDGSALWLPHCTFIGCTALLRRSAVVEAGGFWSEFYHEELDLSLRLLARSWEIHWLPGIVSVHLSAFNATNPALAQHRWTLRVVTRARILSTYLPRYIGLPQLCLELPIEAAAGIRKRVALRAVVRTMLKALVEIALALRRRRVVLPKPALVLARRLDLSWREVIRYYVYRRRVSNEDWRRL